MQTGWHLLMCAPVQVISVCVWRAYKSALDRVEKAVESEIFCCSETCSGHSPVLYWGKENLVKQLVSIVKTVVLYITSYWIINKCINQ